MILPVLDICILLISFSMKSTNILRNKEKLQILVNRKINVNSNLKLF